MSVTMILYAPISPTLAVGYVTNPEPANPEPGSLNTTSPAVESVLLSGPVRQPGLFHGVRFLPRA